MGVCIALSQKSLFKNCTGISDILKSIFQVGIYLLFFLINLIKCHNSEFNLHLKLDCSISFTFPSWKLTLIV